MPNVQLLTMIFLSKKPQISPSKKPHMTFLDFLALPVFCVPSFLLFSTTGFCSSLLMQIIQSPTSVSVIVRQSFLVLYFRVSSSALVSMFLCMYLASLSNSPSHIFCPYFQFWSHQISCPNFCKSLVFLWVHVCRLMEEYCWLLIIE